MQIMQCDDTVTTLFPHNGNKKENEKVDCKKIKHHATDFMHSLFLFRGEHNCSINLGK